MTSKLFTVILVGSLCVLSQKLLAQQDFYLSQSFVNPSLVNPGLTALQDGPEVALFNRHQWIGSGTTPNTQVLVVSSTYKKPRFLKSSSRASSAKYARKRYSKKGKLFHAFNFMLINDHAGAFGKIEGRLHWSPQIRITKNIYAGIGPTISFSRFQINPSKLNFADGTDESWAQMQSNGLSNSSANVSFGGNIFSKDFCFGVSFSDALNQSWIGSEIPSLRVDRNLIFNGSYKYAINEIYSVEVAAASRLTFGAPLDHSINVRAVYNNLFWAGLGFRTSPALNFSAGAFINQKLKIAYTSERSFVGIPGIGLTHELYVSFTIPTSKYSKF